MTNLSPSPEVEAAAGTAAPGPAFDVLPGLAADLEGLPILRLLPRSRRRLVGPWCFLDSFGPVAVGGTRRLDVPPHPHVGLQTVSWILEGEVLHHDSLGLEGLARPGVLNLMTAGRGIAHAEQTPPGSTGGLRGLQLWVALPDAHRAVEPAFEQHARLPRLAFGGAQVTLFLGCFADAVAPGRTFSPLVGADVSVGPAVRARIPLEPAFEHAVVSLDGPVRCDDRELPPHTLVFLGTERTGLDVQAGPGGARFVLLGGAPFGESVLMWWNFVARTPEEIAGARDDWEAGRRFGEVLGHEGPRLAAPPLSPARPKAHS